MAEGVGGLVGVRKVGVAPADRGEGEVATESVADGGGGGGVSWGSTAAGRRAGDAENGAGGRAALALMRRRAAGVWGEEGEAGGVG
jgi:hypothetical protein